MAKSFTVHQLVIKTLGDVKFRTAIIANPEKALRSIGVKPTKAQIAALKSVDWPNLERVYQSFQAGIHPDTFT